MARPPRPCHRPARPGRRRERGHRTARDGGAPPGPRARRRGGASPTALRRPAPGTWTFLSDPRFGEHDLSAAAFTLDTTFLSNTAFTRKRCCAEGFERYARNTRAQGGPGNTGQLDNFALALDGDGISWLPNFSYHLALVSRGPGRDGTAREWGYAAGVRYEHRWSRTTRTLFFAKHVEFRNTGGRPLEAGPERIGPDGEEMESLDVPVSERRRFTTLGARTSHGRWRATVAWQRDQRKRSINTVPTESFLEFSAGASWAGASASMSATSTRAMPATTARAGSPTRCSACCAGKGGL